MTRAAVLLALAATLGVVLASCADRDTPPAASRWEATALGTPVLWPVWVPQAMREEAAAEIDAALVPQGWRVVVAVPIFATEASPTGLARGLCEYETRTLTVGWRARPWEERPLLPALAHEVQHAVTGDPCAGHDPADCGR